MCPAPVGLSARAQIAPFVLERPMQARDAAGTLASSDRVTLMAGGLDVIDRLKGGAPIDRLVTLAGVCDLRAIVMDGSTLSIGAAVTHRALIASPVIAAHLPDLSTIWRGIANPRIRAAGTIGGNLMAGQRHYDAAPALLSLGADATVMTPDGATHIVALTDALDRSDIVLVALRIPDAARKILAAERSLHPIVSVYVVTSRDDGATRIAIGCAYDRPCVVVVPAGAGIDAALAALPMPRDDAAASGAYRRRMIGVLTHRLADIS